MMTDTPMAPHLTFLDACFGIYADNEARGRLCVEALCGMAQTGAP